MFKIKANPSFWATVLIPRAGEDPQPLQVQFKHRRRDEIGQFVEDAKGKKDDDLIPELVVGWRDVEVEFSTEALRDVLQEYPGAGAAIVASYFSELTEAKRKNS